ncbi:MAG: phosphotransferase [Paramuribaculum sp.]|nr:phosphotransferase [Paramuribaculum sp.]
MKSIESLYQQRFGDEPVTVETLPGAGSSRCYYRIHGHDSTVIATVGRDRRENRAFLALTDHFLRHGLPVPEVLAVSSDESGYIQEDLGSESLYDLYVKSGSESPHFGKALRDSVDMLVAFHAADYDDVDTDVLYPRSEMDRLAVRWDLNYFKYCFLKLTGVEIDEQSLEDVFGYLTSVVCDSAEKALILRDFQSRNIMLKNGSPVLIDYQGARIGNPFYDVASLLWQSRLGLSDRIRWGLAGRYVEKAREAGMVINDGWEGTLRLFVVFRMLQVLGAYGFRGLHQHKAAFLTPIRTTLKSLEEVLSEIGDKRLAYLMDAVRNLTGDERFKEDMGSARLKVKIYSFSYKKGIPEDFTGNGGGFVFDCRAIHNPGRYEQYRSLTGLDRPVQDFLEKDGEILEFLDSCKSIVDHSVGRYLKRGFSDLSISFGCTGGQHRSVYSAQKMAEHVAVAFDCDVLLVHREQGIEVML